MKKWLWVALLASMVIVPLFWAFLKEVEENGAAYGMLDILGVILAVIGIGVFLVLFSAFGYLGSTLWDKYVKKLPSWLGNILSFAFVAIGLLLGYLLYAGVCIISDTYDNYMFQKKFEYKYHIKE